MGRKKTTGLFKKRGIWQIDKRIGAHRLRESTGTSDLQEAELILAKRIDNLRQVIFFGERPKHYFHEAVSRYLEEKKYKASISSDIRELKYLSTYFHDSPLESIHMGTLKAFIDQRKKDGVKNRTINKALQTIRHLLNLSSSEWLNEDGSTWLNHAPKIRLLRENDKRLPYPLSWEEQQLFFSELPNHLRQMALFKVNTGCREQEVCRLQWEWEYSIPELSTSVFVIPKEFVKNDQDRLIVLNDFAKSVIEQVRGTHPVFVFTYRGEPVGRMLNSAWKRVRQKTNLFIRVHDLKHTFGRRLRAAGVSFEDRQDLLGHQSGRITTHYSAAEIRCLIAATNKVCQQNKSTPTLTLLRRVTKIPTISPPHQKGKKIGGGKVNTSH